MDIEIHVEEIEQKYILRLEGRIDTITAPFVEKRINEIIKQNHLAILVDFSNVEYLSSAGLRLLLSSAKKLKAVNGHFVIFSVNDDVLEIIKMAGFERVLKICRSEKEALQACS